ncbi:MAG: PEP-utilizing enzyme [Candidatus Moraniibacteriota bacterium]
MEKNLKNRKWEFAVSRKIGLFEVLCAEGAYRSMPFGCKMDNVLVNIDGIASRYNSTSDLEKLHQSISSNDLVSILQKLALNDDELAAILLLDPISHRKRFIDAVKKTWAYEILAYYVGVYSKDSETLRIVEQLRGVHNAQHVAATDFFPTLLSQISSKIGISTELLKYATPEEVIELRLDERELYRRQKFYIVTTIDNQTKFFVGDEAREKLSDFMLPEEESVEEEINFVHGMTAHKGVVQGRVSIVNDEQDLCKLKEGDILVSIMTRTTLVSGMKIAGAIVTNEGGTTCHAAIIAREFKKPCVVGTKIATKVFKDGDTVEVDADNGVVRLLKKA